MTPRNYGQTVASTNIHWDDITAARWQRIILADNRYDYACISGEFSGILTIVYQRGGIYSATYVSAFGEMWVWEEPNGRMGTDDPNMEITWDRIASIPWKCISSEFCRGEYVPLKDRSLCGVLTVEYVTDNSRQMDYWAQGTVLWAEYDNGREKFQWDWPMDR